MFRPERWEYRITLTDVDRGINADRTLVVSRHPSEPTQHLTLRLLAYCLIYDEGIQLGHGVGFDDDPDLFVKDLTGHLATWVGCGDLSLDVVKKVVQHNRDAKAHVVFSSQEALEEFRARVRHWAKLPKHWQHLTAWVPPVEVLTHLETMENLRQKWVVTISGGHMYLEVDGVMVDGAITRVESPA